MNAPGRDELEGKLRVAFRILGDYARVLERHEQGGVLIPESELPAGRDTIKACVLLAAAYRVANGGPRRELAAAARISYATLAHFVPDDLAQREADFNDSAQQALGHIARQDAPPAELAGKVADAPLAEMERVRSEFAALEAEFDAALSGILDQSPLS
ncbi:MAG TPA: hypothetical protein VGK27_04535 [Candidatus Deferrimicrobiaceae bacterium]|jgi:hypothetical protein